MWSLWLFWQHIKHWFRHDWFEYEQHGRRRRFCAECGDEQEFIFVPAAPGAFGDWVDL